MVKRWQSVAVFLAAFVVSLNAPAHAGQILDVVKSRNELRCGVSEGIAGFSEQDAKWYAPPTTPLRIQAAPVMAPLFVYPE